MPKAEHIDTISPAAPLLSGKALDSIEDSRQDGCDFYFAVRQDLAELAVFQAVIADCTKNPGHDVVVVEHVAELVQKMVDEYNEEDVVFNQKSYERFREVCRWLTATPAQGIAGLRAKAILVRRYNSPSLIQPTGYEDEAVGWSLAGDLLGLASVVYRDDGK